MTDEEMRRVIGENIRRVLRDKRRTQTWLAKEIGSTRESIGQSIAGKAAISIRRVCEIAEALDVPVADLLLYGDDREALAIGRKARRSAQYLRLMWICVLLDDEMLAHVCAILDAIVDKQPDDDTDCTP